MTDISQLAAPLPRDLDGFRIEIDAARERGDIILDRPPLNIITMPQREQLRVAFEALDADPAVRVSYCGQRASIFRAAAKSAAFSMPHPSMFRGSPGTSQRRRDVRSRLLPRLAAIVSASVSSCRSPATFASSRRLAFMHCRSNA